MRVQSSICIAVLLLLVVCEAREEDLFSTVGNPVYAPDPMNINEYEGKSNQVDVPPVHKTVARGLGENYFELHPKKEEETPVRNQDLQAVRDDKESNKKKPEAYEASDISSHVHNHDCIHDTPVIQRSLFDGMDNVVPQKTLRQGFDTQAVNSVRIVFSTEDLDDSTRYCASSSGTSQDMLGGTIACSADHILTTSIKNSIIDEIMPAAIVKLSAALSCESISGNLMVNSGSCSDFTKPASHISSGVANADLIMYVAGAPTSGTTAAWASACQYDGNGRAIVGRVNFGPKYADWASGSLADREGMVNTATHEILHAMGITNSQFSDKSTIDVRGKTGITIVGSTKVTTKAREYFNCSTLTGVELEDEGSSGSAGSHWERRLLRDEVMAASSGGSLSPITLAALDDQGHYTIDYAKAEDMKFGKNGGCSFISEKCNTVGGGSGTFFCFAENEKMCTTDKLATGVCSVSTYSSDLLSYFQYFADPTKGGGTFMDGCPVPQAYSNGYCEDTDNTNTGTDPIFGRFYGNGSRCFDTSGTYGLLKNAYTASTTSKQRCLQISCPDGGARIEFRVDSDWFQCPMDGSEGSVTALSGYQGAVVCPTAASICDTSVSLAAGSATPTSVTPNPPVTTPSPQATQTTPIPPTPSPITATSTSAPPSACDTSYLLTGTSPSSVLTIETINNILTEHNTARRNVFPWATEMPMLEWDQALAEYAQTYGDSCPHGSSLSHSSSSDRSANIGGFSYVGENLAAGSSSTYLPPTGGALSVKAWNDEKADYTYSKIGDSDGCTEGKACGHYTQNIWAESTKVGCGYTRCDSLTYKNYWGCVYGKGGNYQSQYPYISTNDSSNVAACQVTGATSAPTPSPPNTPSSPGIPATPSSPGAPATSTPVTPPTPGTTEEPVGGIPYVRGRFRLRGTQYDQLLNSSGTENLKLALRQDLSRLLNILIRHIRIDSLGLGSLIVDYTLTSPDKSVEEADVAVANSAGEGGFSATQAVYSNATGSSEVTNVTETSTIQGTSRGESLCSGLSARDCAIVVSVGSIVMVLLVIAGILLCVKSNPGKEEKHLQQNEPHFPTPRKNPVESKKI